MTTGILLLNFGEPEKPTLEEVVPFLERIFVQNASLMGRASPQEVQRRSRELAEARAPGLIEEYEEIGGSPLLPQARDQAKALAEEMGRRGVTAVVELGMQFTEPNIRGAVAALRDQGAQQVIAIPVYPLAGPSTSVASLREVDSAIEELGWQVRVRQVNGWHRHPAYLKLRADAIRRTYERNGLSLEDPHTQLVFSAHGTPIKYLEEGSRYGEYVQEICTKLAAELGVSDYVLGYQNHSNRPGVAWTQPDIDDAVAGVVADCLVVDALSFMHEQSETLAELDHELREEVEARGLRFYRVPIPHAEPEFIALLADLVEAVARGDTAPGTFTEGSGLTFRLGHCACKAGPNTFCTNRP